jgi:uncharacterized membrane protein
MKKLTYLKILNKQYKSGKITKKEYKKEIRWIRKIYPNPS